MNEENKLKIIGTGADIIHAKGFNNTGIQEILTSCGVPKGLFYYYFKSKEDFGIEVIRHYNNTFSRRTEPIIDCKSMPPLDRLRKFFKFFKSYFRKTGWTRGCPIGNLAQEMGDLSEPMQKELSGSLDRMTNLMMTFMDEAKELGDVSKNLDSKQVAAFIIGAWHGALMQMKIRKNGDPLDNFERHIFEYILKN